MNGHFITHQWAGHVRCSCGWRSNVGPGESTTAAWQEHANEAEPA